MISKLHAIYEEYRLYRANPCDVGAHPVLYPIQRGLIALSTDCPCCNGVRILAVAIVAAVAPLYALSFLAGVMITAVIGSPPPPPPPHEDSKHEEV